MNGITVILSFQDNQTEMNQVCTRKFVIDTIPRAMFQCILDDNGYKNSSDWYSVFSINFRIPLPWWVSPIIQSPSNDISLPPVDYPSLYLSVCPIRYPLWCSVSYCSQGSIVQGSYPHKCSQKVNCRAFNAVVAAFP